MQCQCPISHLSLLCVFPSWVLSLLPCQSGNWLIQTPIHLCLLRLNSSDFCLHQQTAQQVKDCQRMPKISCQQTRTNLHRKCTPEDLSRCSLRSLRWNNFCRSPNTSIAQALGAHWAESDLSPWSHQTTHFGFCLAVLFTSGCKQKELSGC